MSFTRELKAQLSHTRGSCALCDKAELTALIQMCLSYHNGAPVLLTENEDVAERIQLLFERIFKKKLEYLCKNGCFRFFPEPDYYNTVAAQLDLQAGVCAEMRNCCCGAYVRGAFLAAGSMNDPRTSYHMEFSTKSAEYAEQLYSILKELSVEAKRTVRKNRNIIYIKEYETIADVLGIMGAVGTAMELYNISIEKELRNSANRQANCEIANIEKITRASAVQLDAIHKIESTIGFDELPETLREIAFLRKQYPEEGLREIGQRLMPPLGKSGVNHRLKRIMEIADKIKNEGKP